MTSAVIAGPLLALLMGLAPSPITVEGGMEEGALTLRQTGGAPLVRLDPLFGITFTDGTMLEPTDMELVEWSTDGLRGRWVHRRAAVELTAEIKQDRLLLSGKVTSREGVIIHVAIPHTYQLCGSKPSRFLWPETLGVELNSDFLSGSAGLWLGYPPAFCDFVSADFDQGSVHIYRAEAEARPLPATLHIAGGSPPRFRRFYSVYVQQGRTWQMPAVAIQIGGGLREALLRYKDDCRLGRRLDQKLEPKVLQHWRGLTTATVRPPFSSMTNVARQLRLPAVLEPVDWMGGGFDRMYPNFLPPREAYGGEAGFRELIDVAHEHGHVVTPYTNWTWWSAGWDGPNSEPAPMLTEHGETALAKGLDGEPVLERYGRNFGFTVTPGHPIARRHRLDTMERLLSDYGVDYAYFDQVGPRPWILDLNPHLPDPAAYGAQLMQIHREMAAGLPVGGEFGNDRALDFLCSMNYWCLPPLSGHAHWPGVDAPPWPEGQARSLPFALYLSSGDALISLPDCVAPVNLSWAVVLGGRVGIGWALDEGQLQGPRGDRIRWLQELARALGPTRGEELLSLSYLAPRVLEARYETHRVIGNFSEAPWVIDSGCVIAPGGFELLGDTLRAGDYQAPSGGRVSAFRIPNTGRALQIDARGLRPGWPAVSDR